MYLFIATLFYKGSQMQHQAHAQNFYNRHSVTMEFLAFWLYPALPCLCFCQHLHQKSLHPHSCMWIFKCILKPNGPNKITSNKPSLSPLLEGKVFLLLFTPVTLHFSWKQNTHSFLLRWTHILPVGASAICLHVKLGKASTSAGKTQLTVFNSWICVPRSW